MKWWQVYSKVLPDLTNGFDVLTDSGKHSHQPCINLFVSTIMFNKNVQNEWNGHGPWPSALRHWLAMDHLALAVGCLLPANTLTDLGRQERRSSKSKWSPQKLHSRYYVQINLRNVVSKRNTTVVWIETVGQSIREERAHREKWRSVESTDLCMCVRKLSKAREGNTQKG